MESQKVTKAKQADAQRSSQSGSAVEHGAKLGKFTAMGTAVDGTLIVAPKQKPKSFTVRQLRDAVRAVKNEERRAKDDAAAS